MAATGPDTGARALHHCASPPVTYVGQSLVQKQVGGNTHRQASHARRRAPRAMGVTPAHRWHRGVYTTYAEVKAPASPGVTQLSATSLHTLAPGPKCPSVAPACPPLARERRVFQTPRDRDQPVTPEHVCKWHREMRSHLVPSCLLGEPRPDLRLPPPRCHRVLRALVM